MVTHDELRSPGAHFAVPPEPGIPRVIFATASPCKFEASVTTALGAAAWNSYQDGVAWLGMLDRMLMMINSVQQAGYMMVMVMFVDLLC